MTDSTDLQHGGVRRHGRYVVKLQEHAPDVSPETQTPGRTLGLSLLYQRGHEAQHYTHHAPPRQHRIGNPHLGRNRENLHSVSVTTTVFSSFSFSLSIFPFPPSLFHSLSLPISLSKSLSSVDDAAHCTHTKLNGSFVNNPRAVVEAASVDAGFLYSKFLLF